MATGTILLAIGGGILPDGTGTGNVPAQPAVRVSTGAQGTNTPFVTYDELLFDAATDAHALWSFRLPQNYASAGTLKFQVANKTTQTGTNTFVVKAALAAVTPGAAERVDNKSFPVADTLSIALALNQAAETLVEGSLALSATALNSAAAGDWIDLFVGRDADNVSDTATGDMALVGLALEYTTL